jgi:hypothetical protein
MGALRDHLAGSWRFLAWLGSILATGGILFALDLLLERAFGEAISFALLGLLIVGFILTFLYYVLRKESPELGRRAALLMSVRVTGTVVVFGVVVCVVLVLLPTPN